MTVVTNKMLDLNLSQLLATAPSPFWRGYLVPFADGGRPGYGLNLGVMVEPYLSRVLTGTKTVESRFSLTRIPPYGWVGEGDVVLLKASGGPIVGLARVTAVWQAELDPTAWDIIERDYLTAIEAEPDYLAQKRSSRYATLMTISDVARLDEPVTYRRLFGAGWQVIVPRVASSLASKLLATSMFLLQC